MESRFRKLQEGKSGKGRHAPGCQAHAGLLISSELVRSSLPTTNEVAESQQRNAREGQLHRRGFGA